MVTQRETKNPTWFTSHWPKCQPDVLCFWFLNFLGENRIITCVVIMYSRFFIAQGMLCSSDFVKYNMNSFGQLPFKTSVAPSGLWCLYRLSNVAKEEEGWILQSITRLDTRHYIETKPSVCECPSTAPWCTMIWMSVHLFTYPSDFISPSVLLPFRQESHHFLYCSSVVCLWAVCNYNVPFWGFSSSKCHWLMWFGCRGSELYATIASLVSCSFVSGPRGRICVFVCVY